MLVFRLAFTVYKLRKKFMYNNIIVVVAHGANSIDYVWKYGNNQSIVVNEDVKLSQFDIISYSHVNGTTILKDSKSFTIPRAGSVKLSPFCT